MYELVKSDHELLSTNLEMFDFNNPSVDPKELSDILLKKMHEHRGLGLSSNQLGLPYRVFAMRGEPNDFVCFNPKIVNMFDQLILLEEGCLTYPDLYVKIKRPFTIRVRFQDLHGEVITETFTGISSRCFQHEMDHLNGINYLERASKFHLDAAKKKIKLVQRKRKRFAKNQTKMMREEDGN